MKKISPEPRGGSKTHSGSVDTSQRQLLSVPNDVDDRMFSQLAASSATLQSPTG